MKQLYVCYQTDLVGKLIINEHQHYQFQYDRSWLDNANAFALSCSLPLQLEPFTQQFSYAFFSNLIPEGNLRHKIASVLGISEKNDFALLDAIGGEVAGAISLLNTLPSSYPVNDTSYDTTYDSTQNSQRDLSAKQLGQIIGTLDTRPFLVAEEGLRLSLAGAQNKLPVIYQNQQFSLPLGQTPSTHILKPDPNRPDIPHLAVNEAYCMALAKACDLQVANAELIHISEQECFLTQRYDRENGQRLHQEDFCQALGILPFNKYESEGGPSFSDCSQLITQFSSRPAADKKLLLRWTLFNYLIGNADAHGKNISFLHQPHQHQQLVVSPFYDLLSTAIYPDLNVRLSMKVGKENRPKWIMQRHWQRYCDEIQVPYSMLLREAKVLIRQLPEKAELLAQQAPYNEYPVVVEKIKTVTKERGHWLNTRLISQIKPNQ